MFLTLGVEVGESVKPTSAKEGVPTFGQGMQDEKDDTLLSPSAIAATISHDRQPCSVSARTTRSIRISYA